MCLRRRWSASSAAPPAPCVRPRRSCCGRRRSRHRDIEELTIRTIAGARASEEGQAGTAAFFAKVAAALGARERRSSDRHRRPQGS